MISSIQTRFRGLIASNKIILIVVALIAGSTAGYAEKNNTPQTLVIEFAEVINDPESPLFLDQLSEYSGIALQYVKPLTKTRHVFRVARQIPPDRLDRAIFRLGRRDDIRRAELDPESNNPGKGKNAKVN